MASKNTGSLFDSCVEIRIVVALLFNFMYGMIALFGLTQVAILIPKATTGEDFANTLQNVGRCATFLMIIAMFLLGTYFLWKRLVFKLKA